MGLVYGSQTPSSVENRAPPSPFQPQRKATTTLERSPAAPPPPRLRAGGPGLGGFRPWAGDVTEAQWRALPRAG